jgi:undecaprenyl-diphosphatase
MNSKLASLVQENQPPRDVLKEFRSPGLLAKQPIIGWIMFIFGSLVFGALTYNLIAGGPLLAWDRSLATLLPAMAVKSPAFIEVLMNAGFYLGKEVIMVLDLLLAIYFFRKKYWQEFSMVTIGWIGAALLFYFMSTFIARTRPPTMIGFMTTIPGFPSGHAISAVTFYGLMAYMIVPRLRSIFGKIIVIVLALIIIIFIGFGRIFTGGHYLTDIISGYAVGIAWSGAVYTLIEIFFQKRMQNVKK